MNRKINFYAGPATLPVEVLEQLRDEMVDYHQQGLSMVETSHRSGMYETVHQETTDLLKDLMGIPDNYQVVYLGGGATLQFAMVPMNLLPATGTCDIIVSGAWAKKAYEDARKIGNVNVLFDGKANGYTTLPNAKTVKATPGAAYLHITSNETIGGVQWKEFPVLTEAPLIADMSSDILSRPVEVKNFGLIYAGAQKNIGPAGVAIVIIREDLLERSPETLPVYLSYKIHAEKDSLYNTPPVFSIYAVHHVLKYLKDHGGVSAVEERNRKKADALYKAMDESGGFYRCPVDKAVRSDMNIVFRLPSEDLEKTFVTEAEAKGMIGLKGHRSVGGCRASVYNAMPLEGALALADFMKDFARTRG
ncbi:MAG: 3-phosphoserine/phosphohydroxythreonine transaminase [Spirochaetales bacterium]|nr:3-phosphoserine/phosphohydroxythreonine transaminase [Spirochaetales bacterium]